MRSDFIHKMIIDKPNQTHVPIRVVLSLGFAAMQIMQIEKRFCTPRPNVCFCVTSNLHRIDGVLQSTKYITAVDVERFPQGGWNQQAPYVLPSSLGFSINSHSSLFIYRFILVLLTDLSRQDPVAAIQTTVPFRTTTRSRTRTRMRTRNPRHHACEYQDLVVFLVLTREQKMVVRTKVAPLQH